MGKYSFITWELIADSYEKLDEWININFSTLVILFLIGLAVGSLYLTFIINKTTCEHRFRDSGLMYRYEPTAGCMVEASLGIWVPSDSYYWEGEK